MLGRRRARELDTVSAMVRLYCRDHHGGTDGLCPDCANLLDYSTGRLDKCPYGESKPTCAECPVHCYRPASREQIRIIMRYAGPRMLLKHPILALRHQLDTWRDKRHPPKKPW